MNGANRERIMVQVSPDWFEWRDKETDMYLAGFKTKQKAERYGDWNGWHEMHLRAGSSGTGKHK